MSETLVVEGLVERPGVVSTADLDAFERIVDDAGSVTVGALGRAVSAAEVVDRAAPLPEATHCTVVSGDETYRASIPIETLVEGGWIAFGLGGMPLPESNGGPFRLTVADGSTLCWNVKNVGTLRFTSGPEPDDVPDNPPH
jgi:DMSO/TMAO reductase YedYZ molybdopterin-dependent catalytic subunit